MSCLLLSSFAVALSLATGGGGLVNNPGFEDVTGGVPFNEFTFGPFSGWELYDPQGIAGGGAGPVYYVGTLRPREADPKNNPGIFEFFPGGAAEGQRVAIAFNYAGSGGQGEYGLQQTLTTTLQAGLRYRLRVAIGNIASGTAISGDFFNLDGFPGYRVELLAGGEVLAADDNSLAGTIGEGEFGTSTVEFAARAGHPQIGALMGIRLINLNEVDPAFPAADLEVDFDDVRLEVTPVTLGDLTGDGVVNVDDLLVLINMWGPCAGGPCAADLNQSGAVNVDDLLLLINNWG